MGILIFFFKIPPILKIEVGFFSGKRKFFADFPKYGKFICSKLHICKFEKKSEKLLGVGGRSGHDHSLRSRLVGEGRRS